MKTEFMRALRAICMVVATFLLAGLGACASIASGTHQEVSFTSNPDGATVSVGGRILGKAPLTASLTKQKGQILAFEKEGYKPITMSLDTRINGWFWGNIVIGGVVGSTTDAVNGSIYEYSPTQYMVTLEPAGTSRIEGPLEKSQGQKAKEFIVVDYSNILHDLSTGKGPHLSSLLTILQIPQENRDDATKKIRALSEIYLEIPDFADHVISLYLK